MSEKTIRWLAVSMFCAGVSVACLIFEVLLSLGKLP